MRRRAFLAGLATLPALHAPAVMAKTQSSLIDSARRLASQPYLAPQNALPPPFADLTYDAYRGIRPIPGRAAMLPHGPEFAVDLLPPGLYFPDPVRIDRDTGTGPEEIPLSLDLFDFQDRYFDTLPDTAPGAGFSGLRLRHPLNAADRMDEVLVVQGASYFRALGRNMIYGLSARAVAIGTGGPTPEEFPRFTHLRLHPAMGTSVRLEAVIDSPALAGHLDMVLHPGDDTRMDVTVTLMPRRVVQDIGIAPLTSMYLKGPLRASVSDDFRPRVHDSDLLYVENGAGEALWRPISNPAQVETSAFLDDNPQSFGLYQTKRQFEDFEDTEAQYHNRPNAIVRPRGDWGPGAVMLVEIPTGDEFMDNIVAFWRPEAPLAPGQEYRFDYTLDWTLTAPASVLQSRSGREHDRPGTRRYVIDVAGAAEGRMAQITADGAAEVSGVSLFALPGDRGTRITFLFTPSDQQAVDLRLTVEGGQAPGLVWLHRWTRARDGGV